MIVTFFFFFCRTCCKTTPTSISRGNQTTTQSLIPRHASGTRTLSEQSALLNKAAAPFSESFYIIEIAHTKRRLCQGDDFHCEYRLQGPCTRTVPWLCERGEWEPCAQKTLPIVPGRNWRNIFLFFSFFFYGKQARTQLALCRLPVTRVSPPRAEAPAKILRGADGLKT